MSKPVTAPQASRVVLPTKITDKPTVLSFLTSRFPHIKQAIWVERMMAGKVHWQDGSLIHPNEPYRPGVSAYYYREVEYEAKLPYQERILYQDKHLILAYKPHFLPLHPSGNTINECLVNRLRKKTGIETLEPAHRLDRATAGIILCSLQNTERQLYHELFSQNKITKQYQAVAKLTPELLKQHQNGSLSLPKSWSVKHKLVKGHPSFLMAIANTTTSDKLNSHSEIKLVKVNGELGFFELQPVTGKTHQLRLHMMSIGMPILNDPYYPILKDDTGDDANRPLQLLAHRLNFIDPITQRPFDITVPAQDALF